MNWNKNINPFSRREQMYLLIYGVAGFHSTESLRFRVGSDDRIFDEGDHHISPKALT